MSAPDRDEQERRQYGIYGAQRRLEDIYAEAARIIELFPNLAGKRSFPTLSDTAVFPLRLTNGENNSIVERARAHAAKHVSADKRLRRTHSSEFKAAVVAQVADGKPRAVVARESGIVRSLLDVWVRKAGVRRSKGLRAKAKAKKVNSAIKHSAKLAIETLKAMPDNEPVRITELAESLGIPTGTAGFRLRNTLAPYVKFVSKGLYQKTAKGLTYQTEAPQE